MMATQRNWHRLAFVLVLSCFLVSVIFSLSGQHSVQFSRLMRFKDFTQRKLSQAVANENNFIHESNSGDKYSNMLLRHKSLFPLNVWDKAGIVVATVGLIIAAGGGIGGGGILVPVYVLLLRFQPKYAIPLSNITIFGGSITNVLLNLSKRHPFANRPLVDWDLILVMEPLTIAGALVGSFVNKILSEIILGFSLVVLLALTAHRTMKKGIKTYEKETRELRKKDRMKNASALTAVHEKELEADEANEGIELIPSFEKSTDSLFDPFGYIHVDDSEFEMEPSFLENKQILERIYEQEKETSKKKVLAITSIFAVVLTVNLLKGGGAFKSPLGIECGSISFWASTIFILIFIIAVSLKIRDYLIEMWRFKAKCGYRYVEGDVQWSPSATIKYPCLCFFAGFCAGLFGVGGGIVKGPLMLEMDVHPKVASATSACMILYTSFTATTSFIVFGLLTKDYAIFLFFAGLIATFIGQVGVNYLVQRFERSSFIIVSIGAVVALSAVMMGGQTLYFLAFPRQNSEEGGFCSAGE